MNQYTKPNTKMSPPFGQGPPQNDSTRQSRSRYKHRPRPVHETPPPPPNESAKISRSRYKSWRSPSVRNNIINNKKKSNRDYTSLSSVSELSRQSVEYHKFLAAAAARDALDKKAEPARRPLREAPPFSIEGARNVKTRNEVVGPQGGRKSNRHRVEDIYDLRNEHFHGQNPSNRRSPPRRNIVEYVGTQAGEAETRNRTWLELPANEVGPFQSLHTAPIELDDTQRTRSNSHLHLSIPNVPAFCFELTGDSPISPITPPIASPLPLPPQSPIPTAPPLPSQTIWSHLEHQDGILSGYVATLRHRHFLGFALKTVPPRRHWPAQAQAIKEIILSEAPNTAQTSQEPQHVNPNLLMAPKTAYNVRQRRRQSIEGSIMELRVRGRRLREANMEPREVGRRLSVLSEYDRRLSAEYMKYR